MRKIIIITIILIILLITVAFTLFNNQQNPSEVKGVVLRNETFKNITPDEAYSLIFEEKNDFSILDVRTKLEFHAEHIPGATHMDSYHNLDKELKYIIYCLKGSRSSETMHYMKDEGFTYVYNIIGGIEKWKQMGYPTK